MINIGMVIGDRYEVLDRIGTGGMSDVYKAKDYKLNRMVAIKVLKAEYASNAEFVSKFRVEAQAAAGLMHPNIVNVYDVGVENGNYYIVMELVEGITLKNYIEKKTHLSVKESISIAIQVAMGIEAAHNNHIIHRDIKPQNIMISKEGKVKVTDFGIAKAATGDTVNVSAMGSVHYISPEQAKGSVSDVKSDIYSTGITLFEMLTGHVPFNADTTVAIALMQINEPIPSVRAEYPDVPIGLEQIINKCTMKSPDRRYRSMAVLIADLKQILRDPETIFENIPLPVGVESGRPLTETEVDSLKQKLKENGRGKEIEPAGKTEEPKSSSAESVRESLRFPSLTHLPKKKTRPEEKPADKEKAPKEAEEPVKSERPVKSEPKKKASRKGESSFAGLTGEERRRKVIGAHFDLEKDYEDEYDSLAERVMTALTIVAALVIGFVIFYYAGGALGLFEGNFFSKKGNNVKVAMPQFVGEEVVDAGNAIKDAGFTVELAYANSDTYKEGVVISAQTEEGQTLRSGDKVAQGSVIILTVSAGAEGAAVPTVVGMPLAEATTALNKEGFYPEKIYNYSSEYEKDYVYYQYPDGGTITERGGNVTLYVSKGLEVVKVDMPKVMGYSAAKAQEILSDLGLEVQVESEKRFSEEYAADTVCYQSYGEGASVTVGSVVTLYISKGTESTPTFFRYDLEMPSDYVAPYSLLVTVMDAKGNTIYTEHITEFPYHIEFGFLGKGTRGTMSLMYTGSVTTQKTDEYGNTVLATELQTVTTTQSVTFTKE